MNKKYLMHFTSIVTIAAMFYTVLCVLYHLPLYVSLAVYAFSMLIYVLLMTYLCSNYGETVKLSFKNDEKTEIKIGKI